MHITVLVSVVTDEHGNAHREVALIQMSVGRNTIATATIASEMNDA